MRRVFTTGRGWVGGEGKGKEERGKGKEGRGNGGERGKREGRGTGEKETKDKKGRKGSQGWGEERREETGRKGGGGKVEGRRWRMKEEESSRGSVWTSPIYSTFKLSYNYKTKTKPSAHTFHTLK